MQDIINTLSTMTVTELVELTQELEETWGVQALDALFVPEPSSITTPIHPDTFDVMLVSYGTSKIKVIKEVRSLLGLGLHDAKALVESIPVAVYTELEAQEAERRAQALRASGAQVEVRLRT